MGRRFKRSKNHRKSTKLSTNNLMDRTQVRTQYITSEDKIATLNIQEPSSAQKVKHCDQQYRWLRERNEAKLPDVQDARLDAERRVQAMQQQWIGQQSIKESQASWQDHGYRWIEYVPQKGVPRMHTACILCD